MTSIVVTLGLALLAAQGEAPIRQVATREALQDALRSAGPGTTIRIAPGVYRGGLTATGRAGTADRPIVITAADPKRPPVIRDGGTAFYLSNVAHLVISDLEIEQMSGNGLNIDDGGRGDTPTHHITLQRLVVRDVGPRGNHDGIKLSGVTDFKVEACRLERWGEGGSGIDMVGCQRGEIVGCTFRHGDDRGDNGVQAKGGSREIAIRGCLFEHSGQRAVNLGGSTGIAFFCPRPEGHEARDLLMEDCTVIGSAAAVAFVGVDGSVVRRNTFVNPRRWVFRILQETRAPGFVPCRNGKFVDNLIVFRSGELATPVNVGDATAPETFELKGNAWYCSDAPDRSRPRFAAPLKEAEGIYGVEPSFVDAAKGDFRLRPGGKLQGVGASPVRAGAKP